MENEEKKEVLDSANALIEMYKAGFLDAYKINNKMKHGEDWNTLNRFYKLAFLNRFEKRITKTLKQKK